MEADASRAAQPLHLRQQQAIADALAELRAAAGAGWSHEDVPDCVQQAVQQGLAAVEAAEAAAVAAEADAAAEAAAAAGAPRCLRWAGHAPVQLTHELPLPNHHTRRWR